MRVAEKLLREALKLDPNLLQARRELVYLYGMQTRRRDLAEQLEAPLPAGPGDVRPGVPLVPDARIGLGSEGAGRNPSAATSPPTLPTATAASRWPTAWKTWDASTTRRRPCGPCPTPTPTPGPPALAWRIGRGDAAGGRPAARRRPRRSPRVGPASEAGRPSPTETRPPPSRFTGPPSGPSRTIATHPFRSRPGPTPSGPSRGIDRLRGKGPRPRRSRHPGPVRRRSEEPIRPRPAPQTGGRLRGRRPTARSPSLVSDRHRPRPPRPPGPARPLSRQGRRERSSEDRRFLTIDLIGEQWASGGASAPCLRRVASMPTEDRGLTPPARFNRPAAPRRSARATPGRRAVPRDDIRSADQSHRRRIVSVTRY